MSIRMESWILEACVLAQLVHEAHYGYELSKSNTLPITESTLYPVLRRLTAEEYLQAYSEQHNSMLRKYYSITDKGRERLEELRTRWKKHREAVDYFLCGK
jgi:PadR family transcriptional regulator PadR